MGLTGHRPIKAVNPTPLPWSQTHDLAKLIGLQLQLILIAPLSLDLCWWISTFTYVRCTMCTVCLISRVARNGCWFLKTVFCVSTHLHGECCCYGQAICRYLLWHHQKPKSKTEFTNSMFGPPLERKLSEHKNGEQSFHKPSAFLQPCSLGVWPGFDSMNWANGGPHVWIYLS